MVDSIAATQRQSGHRVIAMHRGCRKSDDVEAVPKHNRFTRCGEMQFLNWF